MILTCGLDEAGRGPLAGPVSAACVLLPTDFPMEVLNDSKKLSEKKRNEAFSIIIEKSCWGHSFVDHDVIDKINILQASLLAMKNAYFQMIDKLPLWLKQNCIDCNDLKSSLNAIVDGNRCPQLDCKTECVVKADSKIPQVMAASIIAKVLRDNLMVEFSKKYPEYLYEKHKGYPTKAHKDICRRLGPSPIQRLSFKF